MNLPTCPTCISNAGWTAIYRAEVERRWSRDARASEPTLDYEDEDHGEWADVHCSARHAEAPDRLRNAILRLF